MTINLVNCPWLVRVLDPGGEPILSSKYLELHSRCSPAPTGWYSSHTSSGSLFLLQTDIITENDNLSKCREPLTLGCLAEINISTAEPLHLKLGEYHVRGARRL